MRKVRAARLRAEEEQGDDNNKNATTTTTTSASSSAAAAAAFDRLYAAVRERRYVSLCAERPYTLVVHGATDRFVSVHARRCAPRHVALGLTFGPACVWDAVRRTLLARYHFEVTDEWEDAHVHQQDTPFEVTVALAWEEEEARIIPPATMALVQQLAHSALDALRRAS